MLLTFVSDIVIICLGGCCKFVLYQHLCEYLILDSIFPKYVVAAFITFVTFTIVGMFLSVA